MENKQEEIREDENEGHGATYKKKKQTVKFFTNRKYGTLKSYHELNEMDFAESMKKIEGHYRKQGYLLGFIIMASVWDSVLYKFFPISKFFFGLIMIEGLGEYSVYRNIDNLYSPLNYILESRYKKPD
jgi:hypothetical protein